MQKLRVNRLPMWKRHYCLVGRWRQTGVTGVQELQEFGVLWEAFESRVQRAYDTSSFLRHIILIGVASSLPCFVSVASAHGGGHSGGSSGGTSSSGSSGGHSSSGSNSGHSASASKSGHPAGDPSGPAAMTGGRSVLVSSVRPSTVRSNEVHQFSTGYVPNEQYREWWRKHHRFFY